MIFCRGGRPKRYRIKRQSSWSEHPRTLSGGVPRESSALSALFDQGRAGRRETSVSIRHQALSLPQYPRECFSRQRQLGSVQKLLFRDPDRAAAEAISARSTVLGCRTEILAFPRIGLVRPHIGPRALLLEQRSATALTESCGRHT